MSEQASSNSITTVLVDYQNPTHAAQLMELLDEYARHPMGGAQALSDYTRQRLTERLATIAGAFSVLAYVNDTPAGLVNCFQGFSTFKCKPLINIHDVVVTEAYRGKGVVQALFAHIEQIAAERGCVKLTLEVLQGNHTAQQAYRKLGFASYELDPHMGVALFWEKLLS